jgi:hypothetical protein
MAPREDGGDAIAGVRRGGGSWLEPALWVAAAALVAPLALYAGRPVVPFAVLYGVAFGIALALALAGRRLHAALLHDALRGSGGGTGRALVAVGMMMLVLVLVLLGAVVTILLLFRTGPGAVPGLV